MTSTKPRSPLGLRLMQCLLPASFLLLASPGWSLPEPEISQSANDLRPSTHFQPVDLGLPETATAPSSFDLADTLESPDDLAFYLAQVSAPDPAAPLAQSVAAETSPPPADNNQDLDKTVNESPVIERWQKGVPNILDEIRRDPSFRTRFRLGLSYFPSTYDSLGWNVGIEDIFIGRTGLTVSGDYQATFNGVRQAGGANLRYYILPLGGYLNLAPVLGYRYLETPLYITDGLEVGVRVQASLSRTGAADLSFMQTWVAPQTSEEVGLTTLSFGYALTRNLRLSTDIQKQNSKKKNDTRFAIVLEWMF